MPEVERFFDRVLGLSQSDLRRNKISRIGLEATTGNGLVVLNSGPKETKIFRKHSKFPVTSDPPA